MFLPTNFSDLVHNTTHFDPSSATKPTPKQQAYFKYYGIDFENQLVGIGHHFGLFKAAGFDIAAHYFSQPTATNRGTVFILHGYFDHVGLYKHLIEYCLASGFSVVAYDLPGHGLSSGPRASIESFAQYREVFATCMDIVKKLDEPTQPWHIMAQSTGCAIAMDYLLRLPQNQASMHFDEIFLFAPLVRPVNWRVSSVMHRAGKYFIESQKRTFTQNSNDADFLQFIREHDPLQPLILPLQWVTALKRWLKEFRRLPQSQLSPVVIQGKADRTVDWQYNIPKIQGKFRQPQIHYLEEGRHHLVNESSPIRDEMFKVVDEIINPPPATEKPK
ncbi:MAG: alpha/beta hydrolase [Pseudomonadales bacterium]|nr:alpha/beta hydrolase [Pseudomonadales bacterium]